MAPRFFLTPRVSPIGLLSSRQHLRRYGYVHVPKKTVPHLLGHGSVWRKCRVVYPSTQEINCLEKYQWLTKTRVVQSLPEVFSKIPTPDDSFLNDFEDRLIDYVLQMVNGKRNWRPFSDLSFGLLQAVMPSLWQLGTHYGHFKHSYWALDVKVQCYWRNRGINYITNTNPLAVLYVPASLQLFLFPDQDPVGEPPPDTFNPSHLGLFERSFDEIDVCGGNKRLSAYPLAHTLVVNNRKSSTSEQTTAHALLQLYAQSAAQTIQNGHPLDSSVDYPLSTQAILTNGQDFTFACYQLNTLNFTENSDDDNLTNTLWIGPTLQLFDDDYSNITTNSINRECLELMFKFLLNRTLRKGPSKSGFRTTGRDRV